MLFTFVLCGLALTATSLFYYANKTIPSSKNLQFNKLQKEYLMAYYLATFSDWLQGPYVYKVYSDYGYEEEDIAILYVAGFASSSFFGAIVGHLADKYGRKILCTAFGLMYSVCCLTKLSSEFFVLFFGRVMGGISTSILFSTFEAWYINEHVNHLKLPQEWLNTTFSKACFFTGFLAIIAGIICQICVETLGLGSVSPFLVAIPFLILCSYLVRATWKEHSYPHTNLQENFLHPVYLILFKDPALLVLGLIQSMFEAVMYTFIFSWTPIISDLDPPLGIVFASFMLAFMIGSKLYGMWLSKCLAPETTLVLISGLSCLCLSVVSYVMHSTESHIVLTQLCFLCFILYEVVLGVYFPVIGFLKSRVVPEEHRASISNWFRVPMNIFTCISLTLNRFSKSYEDNENLSPALINFRKFHLTYILCSLFLFLTFLASLEFKRRHTKKFLGEVLFEKSKNDVGQKLDY